MYDSHSADPSSGAQVAKSLSVAGDHGPGLTSKTNVSGSVAMNVWNTPALTSFPNEAAPAATLRP